LGRKKSSEDTGAVRQLGAIPFEDISINAFQIVMAIDELSVIGILLADDLAKSAE